MGSVLAARASGKLSPSVSSIAAALPPELALLMGGRASQEGASTPAKLEASLSPANVLSALPSTLQSVFRATLRGSVVLLEHNDGYATAGHRAERLHAAAQALATRFATFPMDSFSLRVTR